MPPVTTLRARPNRIKALFSRSGTWRLVRFAGGLAGILVFCFAALLLMVRFVVLPQIENYRGEVERELATVLHLPVSIGGISARMQGIRPRLELRQLSIRDEAGRPALQLDHVTAVVAWSSILHMSPRFYLLQVDAPVLAVRRDAAGRFFVAGLEVKADKSRPDLSAWLLKQHTVAIRDARVTWSDELRRAPPLTLDHLDLQLENSILGHRFGMTASPPPALAPQLDVRGKFSGDSIADIEHWSGELYSQVGYTDLAGWHAWMDYPVELTQGRGAIRLWLDFAGLRPTAVTMDMSLADVQIRLAPQLAMLPLHHLDGRISARQQGQRLELSTRQLSLATSDGIRVAPTDLHLLRDDAGGDFTVNTLDFKALSSLAVHLPLPEDFRRRLAAYAPRGSLDQFRLRWQGRQWPLGPKSRYTIKGSFDRLAMASVGNQPGFSGLSGTIDGNEEAGTLLLAGRKMSLSLPSVFHLPVPLDTLDARVRWKRRGTFTELALAQAQFRNADAEGVANGTYEIHDEGKGSIDLDARLSRANGAAVWRYIPLQAGAHVGPFLQAGLTQGKVTEATLKLKGRLDKFPFADRSGTFQIHGVFHDAALRYAEDWPRIEGVAGTIDFDGPAMTIAASEARILGVGVGPARAVIPDMASMDEHLVVDGKAAGPTANFLKFIEQSPVGAKIDRFTADMTASGNGELGLKLVLPLRRIAEATVSGHYRFDANRLLLDPGLPPLDEVRGRLDFSAESLSAKGMTATMLGLPLKLDLKTQGDGSVLADVSGEANPTQLRKAFPLPVWNSLSGSARWNGTVKARKESAEARISSNLVGLSSSLPEPFNKSAKEPMPLVFERKPGDARLLGKRPRDSAMRNLTEISLGRGLHAQLVYRQDAGKSVFERGQVSVGDVAARLPERGLALAIFQPRINADHWHTLLSEGDDKPATAARISHAVPQAEQLAPNRIDLRADEFQLLGRVFHDVKVSATRPAGTWAADIGSREVAAKLEWTDGEADGSARLSGRIARLALPEAAANSDVAGDALRALPNLDLTLDHLTLKGRDYGELHIAAENKGGDWNAKFSVRNDDGTIEGEGRWRLASPPAVAASETQADFKLHARSIERFLNRIGYPNVVKRGNADLDGRLSWKGAPYEFDIGSLSGQFNLAAQNGQFNKLEPGVGRLLGILSLQSIPRRITLDFRDVFSEGFAFDSVKAQVSAHNGVLDTQNMEIRGPAAKVQMAGSINLKDETQDLKVRVQPTVSQSVTTGALLVNPAVGATAWVFNKLFGNPFDSAFAYDFAVTGNWADPKVDKVGAQPRAAANKDADQ